MYKNCKYFNKNYCYFKDETTNKKFCKNMCEHFTKVKESKKHDKNK